MKIFNKIKVIRGSTLIAAAAASVAVLALAGTAEARNGRWKRQVVVAPAPMMVVAQPRPVIYRPAPVVVAPSPFIGAPVVAPTPFFPAPVMAPAYPVYAGPPSLNLSIPLGGPSYPSYPIW